MPARSLRMNQIRRAPAGAGAPWEAYRAASTMAASEGVTPASRFARTPLANQTFANRLRTARERFRVHPFASRACEWPCLRGCAGIPRAISQTAFEAWSRPLASRARARGVRTDGTLLRCARYARAKPRRRASVYRR